MKEIKPCPYVSGFSSDNSGVSFILKSYENYSDFVLFEDGKPSRCFRFSGEPAGELSDPPEMMGMKMADIRPGMKLKSLYGGPIIKVVEMTDKGFKYTHPPYSLGSRIGITKGGEHYGYNGYSHYIQIEDGKLDV